MQEEKKKTVITRAMAREATERICEENGLDTEFLEGFWSRLSEDDAIYQEFVYYLVKGTQKCTYQQPLLASSQ